MAGLLNLKINNSDIEINTENPNELDVEKLLSIQKVESPDMVSVQVNGNILNRDEFSSTILKSGDEINFLYFMGGGAGDRPQ